MSFKISTITIGEIESYISREVWKKATLVPISPARAASQSRNPHADPSDPCLWVAQDDEGKLLGFAGSLPGYNVNRKEKAGWNSCWWADPVYGKEVAMPLLATFLQCWDMRVAFGEMTAHSAAIVKALDFCNSREEPMLRLMFRIPAHKLSERLGRAGRVAGVLIHPLVSLVNAGLQIRFWGKRGKVPGIRLETREMIDERIYTHIREHAGRDYYLRSMEEWRWVESGPWLVPPDAESLEWDRRYPFSYVSDSFYHRWLLTLRDGILSSVQLVSVRRGFVKLLYYYGPEPGDAVAALQDFFIKNRRLYSLVLAHPVLLEHMGNLQTRAIKREERTRYVGVSRKILDHFPKDLHIQMGDGDAIFT